MVQRLDDAGNDGLLPRIYMRTQPAQSPDVNKLDLSIFNSTCKRSQELKGDQKSYEALRDAVYRAYEEYDWRILERVHAFQFEIYRQITQNSGGKITFE